MDCETLIKKKFFRCADCGARVARNRKSICQYCNSVLCGECAVDHKVFLCENSGYPWLIGFGVVFITLFVAAKIVEALLGK